MVEYFCLLTGDKFVSWPTNNFKDEELEIIKRFLRELNVELEEADIDARVILDDEDEKEEGD